MRQLVFGGPGKLSVEDTEQPRLRPGEVRVATHSAGICGSDVHGFTGANARRVAGMVMGHEAVGTVLERAPGADAPEPGQAVVVNPAVTCGRCEFCVSGQDNRCAERRLHGCALELPGAFADSFVVAARNVVPFEGPAPLEWGALVEPFAVGYHGAKLLEGGLERGVLVLGGGPIGLGAALAARGRGVERVVLSEPLAHRREVAAALGIESVEPDVPLEPFDAALECVAIGATLEAALRLTRPGGQVAFVGMGELHIPLAVEPLVQGERVIRGSFNYTREDFAATAAWVASKEVDLSPVIEARVDLDGLIPAFRAYADGTSQAMKTLFQPGGNGTGADLHKSPERSGTDPTSGGESNA
ncbi:MAG TPA: alcohol dehydrogenase catalytic domain-containing protein [Thermoleophilaceae bacterium]|nr:alcohol dehydrogenase catalytic domain-containing protein [Thermoleophilaceae bacterium]